MHDGSNICPSHVKVRSNVLNNIFRFKVKNELSLHYARIVNEYRRMPNLRSVMSNFFTLLGIIDHTSWMTFLATVSTSSQFETSHL